MGESEPLEEIRMAYLGQDRAGQYMWRDLATGKIRYWGKLRAKLPGGIYKMMGQTRGWRQGRCLLRCRVDR